MSSNPAANSPERRKLIAVVYADMVGYSRLLAWTTQELWNDCGLSAGT